MPPASERAVFLSYASQDADAARRICEALRAVGVEVWFDQNELVGGDAWDAKIRKQIKDCTLFVPIISAATQARTEGYFRLEWRLADQRTHLMAKGRPFLLPVVIDDTRDSDAHVPDSFLDVQWTRLPAGETPPSFCARVQKLLTGEVAPVSDRRSDAGETTNAGQRPALLRKQSRPWLVPTILGIATISTLVIWSPWRPREKSAAPATPAAPPTTTSASASETARIRTRLVPDRWQKGDFEALSPTLDRIIQANQEDSDAWALRSIIHSLQVMRNFDSGTKPLEAGKAAAERALRLAPESPHAELALGLHLVAMISRGGDPQAGRQHVARALAALPPDALTRYADLVSAWLGYNVEGTEQSAKSWLAAEPGATFPAWILAQLHITQRRPVEAEKWAEAAAADQNITGTRAFYTLFESKFYLRADVAAAKAALARIAPGGQAVHRVVHGRWMLAMAEQHWDEALQQLAQVPEPMLYDRTYHGPRALLAGLAHQRAGRTDAALAQFREAERLLRSELASDADNEELHLVLAVTLACAGRAVEARSELALVEPLVKGQAASVYWGALALSIAQIYGVLGDFGHMAEWLRKLFVEPNGFPFTPASFRLDPRFAGMSDAPEIQALLKEFASLDQPRESVSAAAADQKSVAVLAFADNSPAHDSEYFSDGISEELINVLAKVPGLKVSARTSAFYFKGKQVPIPEIAQRLGVAYVIEGSVRKSGSKVRITAQLIKTADGFNVWSETYDRELRDIFAVQDEIAKNVLTAVKGSLIGEADLPRAQTTKTEVYTAYLQAQGAFAKRGAANLREAIRLHEAALAIDPNYVPALVGLAQARSLFPVYANLGGKSAREFVDGAKKAAGRALELEPKNAAAHAVIGYTLSRLEWRWSEGAAAMLRARDLAPNEAWNWNCLGDYYLAVCDAPHALAAKQRQWELDPLSPVSHWDLAMTYLVAGDYDQAIHWGQLAKALAPDSIYAYRPIILAAGRSGRGDLMRTTIAEARQNVAESEGFLRLLEAYGAILEKKPAEARRILTGLPPFVESGQASPAVLGFSHLLLGDSDQAVVWLRRAYDQHDLAISMWDFEVIAANPATRPILDQPGLKELYELRQQNARAGLNKL